MMQIIRLTFLCVLALWSLMSAPTTHAINVKVLEVCNYTVTNCTASDNFYGNRTVVAPGQVLEYKFFYSGTQNERIEFTLPTGFTYQESVLGTSPTITSNGSVISYAGGSTVFGTFRVLVENTAIAGNYTDSFLAVFPGSGTGTPAETSANVDIRVTTTPFPIAAMTRDSNNDGSIDGYEVLFTTPVTDASFAANTVQVGNRNITPIELCPARFANTTACQTLNDNRVIIGFADGVYTDTQIKPDLTFSNGVFTTVSPVQSGDIQETDGAHPIVRTTPLTNTSTGYIDIQFSESMNPATLTTAAVQIQPAMTYTVSAVGEGYTTMRITPTTPFTQANYTFTIPAVATDFAGNTVIPSSPYTITISDIAQLAPAPVLSTGSITTNSIQVQWTPVVGATAYVVTLTDNVTSTTTVQTVSTTTTTFTGLVSGRGYRITVYAVDATQTMISEIAQPLPVTTATTSGGGGGGGGGTSSGGGGSYGGATCPYSITGSPYVLPLEISTLTSQIQEHILLPSQESLLGTFTRNITLVNCLDAQLRAEIARGIVLSIEGKPTAGTLRAPYQVSSRQLQRGVTFPNNLASDNVIVFGTLRETFSAPVAVQLRVPTGTEQGTASAPLTLAIYDIKSNTWKASTATISNQTVSVNTTASAIFAFTKGTPQVTPGKPNTGGDTRPSNVDASALNGYVLISWKDPQGAVQHIELYRTTKNTPFTSTPLATIPAGTEFYFDTDIVPYEEYIYRLRAVFADGSFSPWSEEMSIIVDEAGTIIYECIPAIPFRDTIGHWSHGYVDFLRTRCIVSGKQPGVFAGDHSITRAELTKLVIHAYGHAYKLETLPEIKAFPDMDMNAWYPAYIALAQREGIIHGYPDGMFRPNQIVNRAEAMKIITNASGEAYGSQTIAQSFSDTENNAWYLPFVEFGARQKIVEGYPAADGSRVFRPGQAITRSEVAKIIALFIQRDEK